MLDCPVRKSAACIVNGGLGCVAAKIRSSKALTDLGLGFALHELQEYFPFATRGEGLRQY